MVSSAVTVISTRGSTILGCSVCVAELVTVGAMVSGVVVDGYVVVVVADGDLVIHR